MNIRKSVYNDSFVIDSENNGIDLSFGDDFSVAYIEEFSDISDEDYFNLFGSRKRKGKATPGGKKWSKANAQKFAKKAPPLVDDARSYLKRIIGQDPSAVKEKRTKDFAAMVVKSKTEQSELENVWTTFQKAQSAGWDNATNRENARIAFNKIVQIEAVARSDWKKKHDWVYESILDKGAQGVKTVGLAPERELLLLLIRLNAFNIATGLKMAQKRKPDSYSKTRLIFKQIGGNRTLFDKAVNKGYKKKPLLAKAIDISDLGFDGYNLAPEPSPTINIKVEDLQKISQNLKDIDYSKSDDKTLKLPSGVSAAAAALVAAIAPEKSTAAAYAVPVGGVVELIVGTINSAKIPLKGNEKNSDAPNIEDTLNGLKNIPESDVKPDTEWISGIPNWATVTLGIITLAGVATGILILTKKDK